MTNEISLKDEIIGVVERILFQNAENGYCVFILTSKHNNKITVRGNLPNISPGQQVTLQGSWAMHPKFWKTIRRTALHSKVTHKPCWS